jgi:hypothetical protein
MCAKRNGKIRKTRPHANRSSRGLVDDPPSAPANGRHDAPSPVPIPPWGTTKLERRAYVWRCKHDLGLHDQTIADHVHVHRTTVSRDLHAVRRQLAREYEPGGRFSASEVIAAVVDRCERFRLAAIREFHAVSNTTRDKMVCLRIALLADAQMLDVLRGSALLPHDFGTLRLQTQRQRFSAREIRHLAEQIQQDEALGPAADDFVPVGEKDWLYGDGDADADVIDAEVQDANEDDAERP